MKPLKNPRRYIEILKRQRDEALGHMRKVYKDLSEARGKYWFTYEDGVKQTIRLSSIDARECRIQSTVTIKGRVVKIEPSEESGKYVITFSLTHVHIIDE